MTKVGRGRGIGSWSDPLTYSRLRKALGSLKIGCGSSNVCGHQLFESWDLVRGRDGLKRDHREARRRVFPTGGMLYTGNRKSDGCGYCYCMSCDEN